MNRGAGKGSAVHGATGGKRWGRRRELGGWQALVNEPGSGQGKRVSRAGEMVQKQDRLVTLIGGGGFIGRYVAQALFARGQRVRIVARDPRRAVFLTPVACLAAAQFPCAR